MSGGLVIEVGTGDGINTALFAQQGYTVHTFEPSTAMRRFAYERLKEFDNVRLMPYAIGGNDRPATLYKCNGSEASLHHPGQPTEGCTVVSMNHWFVTSRVGDVETMVLDCNGSEYEILEQMVAFDRVRQVQHLYIVWDGLYGPRQMVIEELLRQTHDKLCDGAQQWVRKGRQ